MDNTLSDYSSQPLHDIQTTPEITSQPLHNPRQHLPYWLLGLLGASLLVGDYVLGTRQTQAPTDLNQPPTTVDATPTAAGSSRISSIPTSLNAYLKEKCQEEYLSDENAPVTLSAALEENIVAQRANRVTFSPTSFNCQNVLEGPYLGIDSNPAVYIYDDLSMEYGHDGPPILQPATQKYATIDGVDYYLFPAFPQGEFNINPGNVDIYLKGIKTYQTAGGKPVYVVANSRSKILESNDPRIQELLKPYLVTYEPVTFNYKGRSIPAALGGKSLIVSEVQPSINYWNDPDLKTHLEAQFGFGVTLAASISDLNSVVNTQGLEARQERLELLRQQMTTQEFISLEDIQTLEQFQIVRDTLKQVQPK
jgi:hypothetical protein